MFARRSMKRNLEKFAFPFCRNSGQPPCIFRVSGIPCNFFKDRNLSRCIMHECTRTHFRTRATCTRRRREGRGSVATGMAGRVRRRGRRGPKGLTRALKIENSKWPIFPADGTETKSRPAFIMTCIAVRAAVICTVSLQNARVYIGDTTRMGESISASLCVCACAYSK